MQIKSTTTYFTLLLAIIISQFDEILTAPQYSTYDGDYYLTGAKQPDTLIPRLKTGYNYINKGSVTPVTRSQAIGTTSTGQRRYDYGDADYKFTPLVRYRQTHAKRKQLFVPNFFG